MKLTTERALMGSIFLAVAGIVIITFLSLKQSERVQETSRLLSRTQRLLISSERLLFAVIENETGARGYSLTGNPEFLEPLESSKKKIYDEAEEVKRLLANDTQRSFIEDSLVSYIQKRIEISDRLVQTRNERGLEAAARLVASGIGKEYSDRIRSIVGTITRNAELQFEKRQAQNEAATQNLSRIIFWTLIGISIALIGLVIKAKRDTRIRRKADFEKRKSDEENRRNSALLNNISDAVFSTDKNFVIATWNQAATDMYGFTAKEAIGKSVNELIQPRMTLEEIQKELDDLHWNDFYKDEYECRTKSGQVVQVMASINVMRNAMGDLIGYVAVHRNISERKKAEERIRYLASLVDQASDAIFSLDAERKIRSWNKGAEEMYGYHRSEVIGKLGTDVTNAAYSREEFNKITESINATGAWNGDAVHKNRAGKKIHVYTAITAIKNDKGELTGYVLVVRNITERRMLEEQLRRFNHELEQQVSEKTAEITDIFERVNDGFMAFDKDWRFTYMNKRAGEIFRMDPSWIIGRVIWTAIPGAVGNVFYNACHKAMADQEYSSLEAYSDIFQYWYEAHFYPSPNGLSVYFRDVTERRESEQKLIEAQEELSKERYLLRTLIDNHPDFIYVKDLESNYLINNRAIVGLMGAKSENETVGKDATKFFDEELAKGYMADDKIVLQTRQPLANVEERVFTPNREELWLLTTKVPLLDKNNQIMGIVGISRDITERKKAEELILQQKEWSNKIIDSLPGIFYFVDQKGKFLRWNKHFENISGYSFEEIGEMNLLDFFEEADRKKMGEQIALAFKEGNSDWEADFIDRDKRKTPFYFTGTSFTYQGNPCLMGTAIDISERKKSERSLIESEKRLRTILETEPECIKLLDRGGMILELNPAGMKILEAESFEQVIGRSYLQLIEPSFRLRFQNLITDIFNDRPGNLEYQIQGLNGAQRWVETYGVPLKNANSEIVAFLGVTRDTTERKLAEQNLRESEEKYRLLFSSSPLPMWVYDINTFRFLDVNEAAISHYGYSREEFGKMTIFDLRPPEDFERLMDVARKYQYGIRRTGLWRHIKKDRSQIDVEVNSHDIVYNNVAARLILSMDVTDKLKTEQEIKQSSEQLRELSAHLQRVRENERLNIAREIHDELGQQLTVLKMDVSWLNKKTDNTDLLFKQKIVNILQLLDGTVQTVRRLASELRPSMLDDLGLVAALEWQSGEFQKRTGIIVDFKGPRNEDGINVPSEIGIGFFRIYQESLTNVARHSGANRVKVNLETKNNKLVLNISDNGSGFDVESIKSKRTLGLLGMNERTAMMNGNYELISQPGKGTTVRVSVALDPKLNSVN